jgi:hypothetical protein
MGAIFIAVAGAAGFDDNRNFGRTDYHGRIPKFKFSLGYVESSTLIAIVPWS